VPKLAWYISKLYISGSYEPKTTIPMTTSENKMLVFVYGTLRTGYHNNALLATSKRLGLAVTTADWIMTTFTPVGGFPYLHHAETPRMTMHNNGLITAADAAKVVGEVFEVDSETLKRLDQLEGYDWNRVDNHYNRKNIEVRMAVSGEVIDCMTYVCGDINYTNKRDDLWVCKSPAVDCYDWGMPQLFRHRSLTKMANHN
jgi:gamma-glutamylcyclotransferase (GGCT)/AIG2-like uncharacterized protein YtfP